MARSANVVDGVDSDVEKGPSTKIMISMPLEMAAMLEAYALNNNVTKVSWATNNLAGALGYVGPGVELIKRDEAHKKAGERRSAKMQATKKSATLLEQLKAKLVAGGDLNMDELKAMIIAS